MFGKIDPKTKEETPAEMELVRLALPRRTHTQSHIDYVVESFAELWKEREQTKGYRITYEPPFLRHFTAKFEQLGNDEAVS